MIAQIVILAGVALAGGAFGAWAGWYHTRINTPRWRDVSPRRPEGKRGPEPSMVIWDEIAHWDRVPPMGTEGRFQFRQPDGTTSDYPVPAEEMTEQLRKKNRRYH
jgi:hypothetical protein